MATTPIFDHLVEETCEHGRIASISCWQCCGTCDLDNHRCHFCGDPLRHEGTLMNGEVNPCYWNGEMGVQPLWMGKLLLAHKRGARSIVDLRE